MMESNKRMPVCPYCGYIMAKKDDKDIPAAEYKERDGFTPVMCMNPNCERMPFYYMKIVW